MRLLFIFLLIFGANSESLKQKESILKKFKKFIKCKNLTKTENNGEEKFDQIMPGFDEKYMIYRNFLFAAELILASAFKEILDEVRELKLKPKISLKELFDKKKYQHIRESFEIYLKKFDEYENVFRFFRSFDCDKNNGVEMEIVFIFYLIYRLCFFGHLTSSDFDLLFAVIAYLQYLPQIKSKNYKIFVSFLSQLLNDYLQNGILICDETNSNLIIDLIQNLATIPSNQSAFVEGACLKHAVILFRYKYEETYLNAESLICNMYERGYILIPDLSCENFDIKNMRYFEHIENMRFVFTLDKEKTIKLLYGENYDYLKKEGPLKYGDQSKLIASKFFMPLMSKEDRKSFCMIFAKFSKLFYYGGYLY